MKFWSTIKSIFSMSAVVSSTFSNRFAAFQGVFFSLLFAFDGHESTAATIAATIGIAGPVAGNFSTAMQLGSVLRALYG